jgi:hypothetical protein
MDAHPEDEETRSNRQQQQIVGRERPNRVWLRWVLGTATALSATNGAAELARKLIELVEWLTTH